MKYTIILPENTKFFNITYEDGTTELITGAKCIVVKIDGDKMNGIKKDGSLVVCSSQVKRWWTKTGRHFPEVAELLKKMREE